MTESLELHDLDDAESLFELVDEARGAVIVTRNGEGAYAVLKAADHEALTRRVAELEASLAAGSQAAGATRTPSASQASADASSEGARAGQASAVVSDRCVPYESAELPTTPIDAEDYQRSVWHDAITERMRKVMATEAPVEKQRLFNMVRGSFGIKRSGRDVQSHNEWLFRRNIEHVETEFNDTAFVWRPDQDPESYDIYRPTDDVAMRQITEYPYEELAAAMKDALATGCELSRDELIDATMRLLGYKRKTNRVKEVVGAAIEQANHDGIVELTAAGTFRASSEAA